MKKRPNRWIMFFSLMGIVLLALVLRYFLAIRWVILAIAPLLGVWVYFDDRRWRCPHCHKYFGRLIRYMKRCPYCEKPLDKE